MSAKVSEVTASTPDSKLDVLELLERVNALSDLSARQTTKEQTLDEMTARTQPAGLRPDSD